NPPIKGTRGAEDLVTAPKLACTTDASGTCSIVNVFFGDYWLVETVVPAGHQPAPDTSVSIGTLTPVMVDLVDPRSRGAIRVTKTRKHAASGAGDHPHAGVSFTVNGVTKATDASGQVCFDNLLLGSYS